MKTIFSLLLCTALITSTFALPLPTGELVTVRVSYSTIYISYGNGKTKVVDIKGGRDIEKRQDITTTSLNELIKEGYKFIGVSSGDLITIYVFEKQ